MTSLKTMCVVSLFAMAPFITACGDEDEGETAEGTEATSAEASTNADSSSTAATDSSTSTTTATGDGDGDSSTGDGDTGDGDTSADECGLPGLVDPGPVGAAAGAPVHHFTQLNQNGELTNICQYAGQRMMLDLSAVWCPPCNDAAECISGGDAACGDLFQGGLTPAIQTMVDGIRANLVAGNITWITLLYDSAQNGVPASLNDVQNWANAYPQENVWVILDDLGVSQSWLPTSGIPFFVSVNESFTYQSINTGAEWGYLAN